MIKVDNNGEISISYELWMCQQTFRLPINWFLKEQDSKSGTDVNWKWAFRYRFCENDS